mgnify:CR=1 FL=1
MGVPVNIEGFNTKFDYSPKIISENLFELMINNYCDHNVIAHFIEKLELIVENCPYKKIHVPAITSNGEILNRLISLRIKSEKSDKRTFTDGEANYIDRILLNNIDHDDQNLAQLFQCSVDEIIEFKEFRKNVLSKRKWTNQEEYYLYLQMGGMISLPE